MPLQGTWGAQGRDEGGGEVGRQPPESSGSGFGGANARVPGGEQKLETGSVCRLHDNKGRGDSIHNSATNCPPPLLPGLAQGLLLLLLLGLGCYPLSASHQGLRDLNV